MRTIAAKLAAAAHDFRAVLAELVVHKGAELREAATAHCADIARAHARGDVAAVVVPEFGDDCEYARAGAEETLPFFLKHWGATRPTSAGRELDGCAGATPGRGAT